MTYPTHKRNMVFAAACIGMLLFGIVMISIGSILPSISAKLNLDEAQQGVIATMLPLGILIGSVFFGPIVDRFGYKLLLMVSSLFIIAGLEGIGYASVPWMVEVSILMIAIAGGVINGATNALGSDISADDKSANLSLLGVFYGIGALCMPLALSSLKVFLPSETIIKCVGAFVVIPFIYFVLIRFPEPKQTQGIPVTAYLKLVKEKILLLFGFVLFFQSAVEGLINNWSTSYLKIYIGEEKALLTLMAIPVAMTVTRLVFGIILRKINPATVLVFSILIAILGAIILKFADTQLLATVSLALFGVGLAAGFPVILSYIGQIYASMSGTAFSIALVIALTGNTLLNYLTGIATQRMGIEILPYILTGALASLLLMFIFAKKQSTQVLSKK